ncbi:SidA/IucD/PvdA family monooxygenase [Streptomyces sp. NPDC003753]
MLSAPKAGFKLDDYCRRAGETRLTGHDPVLVEMFVRYGHWFAERLVPEVENIRVLGVDRQADGLHLKLASGEELRARAVVVASGTEGAYVPEPLAGLVPDGLVSHSPLHADLGKFARQDLVVVGASQSAQQGAALLRGFTEIEPFCCGVRRLLAGTPPGGRL